MTPKYFLFTKIHSHFDDKLFNGQTELVSCILDEEGVINEQERADRTKSLYVILNSVINGKRKLGKKLERPFRRVLESKFTSHPQGQSNIDRIFTSLEKAYQENSVKGKNAEKDKVLKSLGTFCEAANNASEIFIAISQPIETTGTKIGAKFIECISENLALYDDSGNPKKYTYIVPQLENGTHKQAINLWGAIYEANKDIVSSLYDKLNNSNNKEYIRVFSIPFEEKAFMLPAVCFDMDSFHEQACTVYLENGQLDITKMHNETLEVWKSSIHEITSRNSYENYECKFDEAFETLYAKDLAYA
ncbi:hypothetical protein [uncultured Allomuricauda sp.]|uniref:hypothetical protein n=1 Tax=Flagellimonas sp. W118 TaxID=3410791 RepID=UPI002609AF7C|nr:hypothetical protein [uncultured Allomuricauda sp.]